MPNATVRANARTTPEPKPGSAESIRRKTAKLKRSVAILKATKKTHPDAELLALCAQCSVLQKARDEAYERQDQIEGGYRRISRPDAVLKTEADARLGLCRAKSIGVPYDRDEIAVIRVMIRRLGTTEPERFYAWHRGEEILTAWHEWQTKLAVEEQQSGLAEARRVSMAAADAFDTIARRIALARATSIEGVLAKARVLLTDETDEGVAERIKTHLNLYGPDEDVGAMSVARDLVGLAGTGLEVVQ